MNTTNVSFNGFHKTQICGLYQWDYGQILDFVDIVLPSTYEVHFAQSGSTSTVTVIGNDEGVQIPDIYLQSALNITAYIYLHEEADDGETVYQILIPVIARPEPEDVEPTPVEQDVITQAIAALNVAVTESSQSASDAAESADAAAQSAQDAAESAASIDMSNYATKAELQSEASARSLADTSLSNDIDAETQRATQAEASIRLAIPNKTSQLTNDSGFLTSAPVSSVNGKSGAVNLSASDVGALPASTVIPSKTSDLTNDSNYITASEAPVQSVNGQTGAVTISTATTSSAGLMSSQDKANLDAVNAELVDIRISADGATYPTAGDAVRGQYDELKTKISSVIELIPYYPTVVRGYVNTSTGSFVPNNTVLNRIIEMEYIPTALYSELHVKNGITAIVFYYDENKTFVNAADWDRKNIIPLDTSKYYARVCVRNNDSSNFDTIPTDAFWFVSPSNEYQTKVRTDSINDAVLGNTYIGTGTASANAASTVRWFIPSEFGKGWLHSILIKGATSYGFVTIELWKRIGTACTRTYANNFNVGLGDNLLIVDEPIDDYTLISMISNVNGALKADLDTEKQANILRDKTVTSFSTSDLTAIGYGLAVDVSWWGAKPQEDDSGHVYYIGENDNVAEVITEAMEHFGSTVYIEPYEHDCIAEWETFFGSGYFANMSSGRGLELKNDVHIIGQSGHKLKCYYTGNNDYVMENFSLFNNSRTGSGYTLENVCIDTKKIRYCIHDERGSDETPYRVEYKRCIMSQDMTGSTWDHSRACIGGGLGAHGDVVVEDCIFSTVTSNANKDSLAYHNSASGAAENSLVIKNCYCTGDSTLQLASYGTSTKMTKVLVANCSFGSAIEELDWTGGTPNFEIYYINNVIRN